MNNNEFLSLELRLKLQSLRCFSSSSVVTIITEGSSRYNFKVVEQGTSYFVKYIAEQNINVKCLVEINKAAFRQGLAPNVIYYDSDWFVTEFLSGESIYRRDLTAEEKLFYCLGAIAKFSQLSITIPQLNIKEVTDNLIDKLYHLNAVTDHQYSKFTLISDKLNRIIQPGITPCHGDVNFSNVFLVDNANILKNVNTSTISTNESLKFAKATPVLIDFECACLADTEYDIAMCLAVNELTISDFAKIQFNRHFSDSSTYTMLSSYLKDDLDSLLVTRYLCFSYFINGLWYLEQFHLTSDTNFEKLAKRQFLLFDSMKFIQTPSLSNEVNG